MRHVEKAGGIRQMEIDHFNPDLTGQKRNLYSNLMLSTRHCNNMKKKCWPTAAEKRKGIRFLNPCKETDYGTHILEDPKTHELVATTPAGQYQIDSCDLNHETFVNERKRRTEMLALLSAPALIRGDSQIAAEMIKIFGTVTKEYIPPIPFIEHLSVPERDQMSDDAA